MMGVDRKMQRTQVEKNDVNVKIIFRILSCLLALWMLLGAFVSCTASDPQNNAVDSVNGEDTSEKMTIAGDHKEKTKDQEKAIDIYLIAGQSNAAGSTSISDRDSAYAYAPELKTGFDHILFSGKASDSDFYTWRKTTLGLGRGKSGNCFGPEAGMAKALSAYYNSETGNTAGFIKVAYGGTNLLNDTGGSNEAYGGNWVSPSYAAAKGYSYKNGNITGGLYRNLLSIARQQITLLESSDYHVNIKGLYWMQGENDRKYPEEYQEAFGYLVQDLRRDLSALVKEITGDDDRGASDLPIWVGTISRTFESAFNSDQKINAAFIEMQKGLADEQNKIFVVDNSTYDINYLDDKMYSRMIDRDQWHWNQPSQLAIGENVGNAMAAYFNLS